MYNSTLEQPDVANSPAASAQLGVSEVNGKDERPGKTLSVIWNESDIILKSSYAETLREVKISNINLIGVQEGKTVLDS